MSHTTSFRNFGLAWLALCAAFAIHIVDEATTGFLDVYNRTLFALGLSAPRITLHAFLILMVSTNVALFALAPFAFQGKRWMRPLALLHATIQIANAAGHIWGTITGHSVASVTFPRPAPGFYSSPLLVAAAVWLLIEVRRSSRAG